MLSLDFLNAHIDGSKGRKNFLLELLGKFNAFIRDHSLTRKTICSTNVRPYRFDKGSINATCLTSRSALSLLSFLIGNLSSVSRVDIYSRRFHNTVIASFNEIRLSTPVMDSTEVTLQTR